MRHRFLLVAALLVVLVPGSAQAEQGLPVVVSPGFDLAELRRAKSFGLRGMPALGLLVPDAGPETSEARARAALVRGEVRNSLRGGLPSGPVLIQIAGRPPEGPQIGVGIPSGGTQPNDRRYLVVIAAPGFGGLLTSESTRIPGLVSIADIARTARGEDGGLGTRPSADPFAELAALDARIDDNGSSRKPAAAIATAGVLALALLFPAAAVLGLAAALVANLALGVAGVSEPWLVWLTVGLAVGLGGPALAAIARSRVAVGAVLVGVLAAYLVAMAADESWVALSPLGPTQNARFYGLSNLLETMLLVPALAGAALIVRRFGPLAFAAAALLSLATVASSRLGADAGGAIVLGAAYGALAVALAGGGRRALAAGMAGAAALAGGALVLDSRFGPETHVGRSAGGGAGGVLSDLADRVVLSWERATAGWGVALVVAAAIVALVLLVSRLPRLELGRDGRALLLSFAVAVAVSLVVNDSPVEVAVGGAVGYLALERYMRSVQSVST
jgi:hypothetical protein